MVTGPNPTPITLVGLRQYSSPNCDPYTGNGCPSDGVPVFSSIFAQDTIANSNYNSLQASLEKRFSRGLQFEVAYTWSKSIDDASSFENILKPICDRCNRALSLFDARQRLVISYLWELPVPQYQGAKGKFLNGWAVSGITSFQTGFPIRIQSSNDSELENSFDFELPGKPDLVAPFRTFDPENEQQLLFRPEFLRSPGAIRHFHAAAAAGQRTADHLLRTLGSRISICLSRKCCQSGKTNTSSSGRNFSMPSITRNS